MHVHLHNTKTQTCFTIRYINIADTVMMAIICVLSASQVVHELLQIATASYKMHELDQWEWYTGMAYSFQKGGYMLSIWNENCNL